MTEALGTGVLEIGGTHVTAAIVDTDGGAILESHRRPVDAHAAADQLIAAFVGAARGLSWQPDGPWGVAIPGPFDYALGIGDFAGVGKFAGLSGVDVGAALRHGLGTDVRFVNDGEAFATGEWLLRGSAAGRMLVLTLGTGIGSGYLLDGVPQLSGPGVPPDGHAHRIMFDGRPLEESASRRALIDAYRVASGAAFVPATDVKDIADAARTGDRTAAGVFAVVFEALGRAIAPSVRDFAPTSIVFGGTITRSWDLIEAPLRVGLAAAGVAAPTLVAVPDGERGALVGAALAVTR